MTVEGQHTDILLRLMSVTGLRARAIAGNVANVNTPGYTRQTVRFEDMLRKAYEDGGDLYAVEPEVVPDLESPARPDGNNVSLELELNAMRENRVLYETYSAILAGHFELLRNSIESR